LNHIKNAASLLALFPLSRVLNILISIVSAIKFMFVILNEIRILITVFILSFITSPPRTSYVLDTDKSPRVTVMLIEDSEAGYAVRLFVRHQAPTASNPIFEFEALIKHHEFFFGTLQVMFPQIGPKSM